MIIEKAYTGNDLDRYVKNPEVYSTEFLRMLKVLIEQEQERYRVLYKRYNGNYKISSKLKVQVEFKLIMLAKHRKIIQKLIKERKEAGIEHPTVNKGL